MDPVLHDIVIVDLSTGVAGPLAAAFLADFGASVTKVELPGGDPIRDRPTFSVCNRNKDGIVLDPARPVDVELLAALLEDADVLFTNGPETLHAFGLSADDLTARLVVVEALASDSALSWPGGAESHGLLAAVAGVAMRQGSTDGGPVEFVIQHLLHLQAVWTAACTVAALVERCESGLGQRVAVSGFNAAMLTLAADFAADPSVVQPQVGTSPTGPNPFYTHYLAGDGRWFLVGALDPRFGLRILDDLDLTSLMDDERITRIEDINLAEHSGRIRKIFEDLYLTKSSQEWMDWLDGLGIPNGPLLEREQWLHHPQIAAMGLYEQVEEPARGTVEMPGVPIGLSRSPGRVQRGAPSLGQHTALVRARVAARGSVGSGPDARETAADRLVAAPKSGPLSGVRVLNLGTFVSGPAVGALLAELGAEVIKIESPAGDPFRTRAFAHNRGMKGVALDLKDPAGQRAFHTLVATSDVVVDNARQGVAARIGADYASLTATNADIVTVSISAFGTDGEMAKKTGFDLVFEAASGVMAAQGGDAGPVMISIPLVDIMAGALAAFGACLALFVRSRGGPGQQVTTSLAAASLMVQAGELVGYAQAPAPPRGGCDFRGADPGDRFYEARDGWIRLQACADADTRTEQLASAAVAAGVVPSGALTGDQVDVAAVLAAQLAEMTQQEVVASFATTPVRVVAVRTLSELIRDEGLVESGLVEVHERRAGGRYTMPGRTVTFSRTPRRTRHTSPGIGEHTREVLEAHGCTSAEVDDLIRTGAAAQGAPTEPVFLPRYR